MVVEVLESTVGLGLHDVRVRFLGEPLHFAVGPGLLGRVFNGVGEPADGGPPVAARKRLRIDGVPINPTLRESAERLHRDRHHRHRPDEQPGARAETAVVLRRRHAA